MNESKILSGLNQGDYDYPLADVSHLSEKEKKDLLRRGMCIPKELHSDEEFEQWITLYTEQNYGDEKEDELTEEEQAYNKMPMASYERGLWYHRKRFSEWKKKHLQPLINELVEHATHDPQYDWQFLYELEYAKLRCMRAYFSHSLIADENGNFGFNRWMDICIRLLQHIKESGMYISRQQMERMNVRNVGDIVTSFLLNDYTGAPMPVDKGNDSLDKLYYGRQIYVRKMERLYYRIRLFKMREWWE